jgi:hypothetical protein
MSDYLFGNKNRSRGVINGEQVVMRTENGETTVKIGDKEMVFRSRDDALNYLRNLANVKPEKVSMRSPFTTRW